MAHNEIEIAATPDQVFAVLADPFTYPSWLVGAKRIRSADAAFPRRGASFRHKVGLGPVTVKDRTTALESRPGELLVLDAKARPIGEATVRFELQPSPTGTRLVMVETVVKPVLLRLLRFVLDPLTERRNARSVRQLRDQIESGQI